MTNYTKNNFMNGTVALFIKTEKPNCKPDYISNSGSEYWYTEKGVYRSSNHWDEIGTCYWNLVDSNYKWIYDEFEICGFAEWSNFKPSICIYDVAKGFYYTYLQNNKIYIDISEKETKLINEKGLLKKCITWLPSIEAVKPSKMNNIRFKELDKVFHIFKGWGIVVDRTTFDLDLIFNNRLEKIRIDSHDYKLLSFSEYNLIDGGYK